MKKIYLIGLWIMFILSSACSGWVDVNPKTDIEADKFYSSEDGFRSVLIGIYAKMTLQETYGANMSFLFTEQLVQRYDNNPGINDEERAKIYNYLEYGSSKDKIETIWLNMYQTIANINDLLAYIETNGDVIKTKGVRDLIKGEALGLRAFHYFDLLRLWGPVYSRDSTAKCIPWRDKFSSDQVPLLAANEVMDKILDDLKEARELLKNDQVNYQNDSENPFFGMRKHRMNKYAVEALMARVYLYRGNKGQAAYYARKVMEECGLSLARDNSQDVSFYEETIFCLGMDKMEEKLKSYWKNITKFSGELYISLGNLYSVFEYEDGVGVNDIRCRNNYGFIQNTAQALCRKYLGENGTAYAEKVPLIRLSEMYYILAESVALEDAGQYINAVRNARGISRGYNLNFNSEEERIAALEKEYQKDFFAEGQFFYFLKRHDRGTFYRCPVEKMIYYVLPLPYDEVEFGNVTE